MKRSVQFLFIVLVMSTAFAVTAQAAAATTVSLGASAAVVGDPVTVSGESEPNAWIAIKVLDNGGRIVFFDQTRSDEDGAYGSAFVVPTGAAGTLVVVAGYGSDVASASLAISPAGPVTHNITVAAEQNGDTQGAGGYGHGQLVSMQASPDAGYNFEGWYADDVKVSGLPNYSFLADKDLVLTAQFVPMPQYTLQVSAQTGGQVQLDGAPLPLGDEAYLPLGAEIVLTAVADDGYAFSYWTDANNSGVISTNATCQCVLTGDRTLQAVFRPMPSSEASEFTVIFRDKTGEILQTHSVSKDSAAMSPADPVLPGYRFLHWDKDFSAVSADMFVNAVYERVADEHTISVVNGQLANGDTSGVVQFDQAVIVVAGAAPAGQVFSHWSQNGQPVSSQSTFTCFASTRDITLTAVFADAAEHLPPVPSITLSEYVMTDGGAMALTAYRDLPSGYTLVESGILLSDEAPPGEGLTVNTPGASRGRVGNDSTSQFNIRKSSAAGTSWYARAYLIYSDGQGNVVTVYSDQLNI